MSRTTHLPAALLTASLFALAGLGAGCAKVDPDATGAPTTGASAPGATTDATAAGASGQATPADEASATPTPSETPKPVVKLSAKSPVTAMLPTDVLEVGVTNGELKAIKVTDADGNEVPGVLSHTTWTPQRNLLPASSYSATLTVTDAQGTEQQVVQKFSTIKTNLAGYDILYTGFELGVGMPATIQFVSPVETQAMRAEIEKHAKVTTVPAQEGSWGWLDNRQLMWRPKNYFTPGTKVTVTTDFAGLQTGKDKWIKKSDQGSFTIGKQRILYTDIAEHTMRVTENGKTIRTIPVTNGKEGFTTRSGTKVISERLSHVKMDSTTVDIPAGSPDAYSLDVKYALRVTWTGEFIHAAPWSVASQGKANVSHGCTGISEANAKWLFDFVRAGDLDIVTGSNRIMKPTEGIGVWQFNWQQWQQQSAARA